MLKGETFRLINLLLRKDKERYLTLRDNMVAQPVKWFTGNFTTMPETCAERSMEREKKRTRQEWGIGDNVTKPREILCRRALRGCVYFSLFVAISSRHQIEYAFSFCLRRVYICIHEHTVFPFLFLFILFFFLILSPFFFHNTIASLSFFVRELILSSPARCTKIQAKRKGRGGRVHAQWRISCVDQRINNFLGPLPHTVVQRKGYVNHGVYVGIL